jgi:branched-chain amino acid transport system permease protein
MRRTGAVLLVAAGLALLVPPTFTTVYWMRVLTGVFMFGALAQALNLIAGFAGYPAFGNVVFLGLGAYGTGVTMVHLGLPFPAGVLVGVAVSVMVALVVGPPLLRLRGHYFAIGTLALNEALKNLTSNLTDVTGGGKGITLPIPPASALANSILFYYLFLGAMLLSLLVAFLVARSRFGYALRAIRTNEEAAGTLGVDQTRAKTQAWAISAALTGLVGGLYAYWTTYFDAGVVFDMGVAVKVFVVLLIGGTGTLLGPILGAFFIEFMATFAWSHFLDYHLGILGLIIVLVVLFMPGGFVAFFRDRVARAAAMFTRRC